MTAPVPQAYELLQSSDLALGDDDHEQLRQVTFEPTFVGLFEIKERLTIGEVGLQDEHLVDGMLKLVNNAEKKISKTTLLSVYMTARFSEDWYARPEEETLAEVERLLQQQLGPVTIVSRQLKRWRYAQARAVYRTPHLKLRHIRFGLLVMRSLKPMMRQDGRASRVLSSPDYASQRRLIPTYVRR